MLQGVLQCHRRGEIQESSASLTAVKKLGCCIDDSFIEVGLHCFKFRKTKNGADGFPQRWETLQRITAHQVREEVYLLVSALITSDVSAQLRRKRSKQTAQLQLQ